MASDEDSSSYDDQWTGLIKQSMRNQISKIHSAGSFATFGRLETCSLPGIRVDGVGPIRLPLSTQDAQALIGASRRAPFGMGRETVVDETVRKTWEIEGDKVVFKNKAWQGWLKNVVRRVTQELGVAAGPDSVRAEFYKMLVYEEGAMFKPHKEYVEYSHLSSRSYRY